MAKKIQVGLVFGGRSGEHEVSLASATSVYNALDKSLYDITLIAIDKDGRWLLPNAQKLFGQTDNPMLIKFDKSDPSVTFVPYPHSVQLVATQSGSIQPVHLDVIVPILHGTYGEDGTIQGLFEMASIPFVGSVS